MCKTEKSPKVSAGAAGDIPCHLEQCGSEWHFTVNIATQPNIQLSAEVVRIEVEGSPAIDLWVPLKARPLNMDASRVSFSRKRGLLKVSWPCPDGLPTKAEQTLAKLDAFKAALKGIEHEVRESEQNLRGVSSPSLMRMVRDELAQVEARLNKLQCAGLDSMELCDLGSDMGAAKLLRKELIQDAEHLQQRIEFMFDRIKDEQDKRDADTSMSDESHQACDLASEPETARNVQDDACNEEGQSRHCAEGMPRQLAGEEEEDAQAAPAQHVAEDEAAKKSRDEAKRRAEEPEGEAKWRKEAAAKTAELAEDEVHRKKTDDASTSAEGEEKEVRQRAGDDLRDSKLVDETVKMAQVEATRQAQEEKEAPHREEERTTQETTQQAVKTADEWKAQGNDAVKAGDYASACENYSAGLVAEPDHAILLSNRALCLHKLGRLDEALLDAIRCTTLRPDFIKGFCRGAMILRELRRPCEALELLRKAPLNDEVEKLSAEVRPEAEAAEALRIASLGGAERRKEEANALFKKGLIDQALCAYNEALELCSDPTGDLALAIRNNRANCHHQLSNYEAVIAETSFVLEHQPDNLKALIRRMVALEPLEKYERALEDARCVLRHAPSNDVANRLQHRLGKLVRDKHREQNGGA